uniref:Uncharacterized protein n=1 Tax=Anopheles epiroticus TaxID=199890 RepID=A0A182PRB2_9DIPT
MGAFELDDDGFLENIFHLRTMEKLKSSHHQAFLKLAITGPKSGVSDVDSSSSGGQPACSDELKARLGIPTSSTGPVSNPGQPGTHPHQQQQPQQQQQQQQHQQQASQQQHHQQQHHQQPPPQHQHPQSQPLAVHPNGGTGSPNGSTTSLSSTSALSQVAAAAVAAAATQQHLQQQAAHLQSGPFLRPNFYHHNSPPLRNIWNQRSVPREYLTIPHQSPSFR